MDAVFERFTNEPDPALSQASYGCITRSANVPGTMW